MSYLKTPTFRSEAWRRAVASLPCACCQREGYTQAAHPNHRGKGMNIKAPDCWCIPLCVECHRDFDSGTSYTKEQRREMFDTWFFFTVQQLANRGLVKA